MLSLPFDTGLSLQRKQPQAGAAAPAAAAGDGHDEYPAGGAAGTSGIRAERRHARHQAACGQLCCKWAETLMENCLMQARNLIPFLSHFCKQSQQDTGASTGPPPSPLTVSIRLTSALILRNLAQRSHLVKK